MLQSEGTGLKMNEINTELLLLLLLSLLRQIKIRANRRR